MLQFICTGQHVEGSGMSRTGFYSSTEMLYTTVFKHSYIQHEILPFAKINLEKVSGCWNYLSDMTSAGYRFLSYWIIHFSHITDKSIQNIWRKPTPVQLYKLLVSAAKTTIGNSWCYFLWRALYIGQDLQSFNYLWVYRTLMLQYYLYRMGQEMGHRMCFLRTGINKQHVTWRKMSTNVFTHTHAQTHTP